MGLNHFLHNKFVRLMALSGFALALAACDSNDKDNNSYNRPSNSSNSTQASSSTANKIALGKTEYDAKCSGCHGATGNGNTPINLANGIGPNNASDLAAYISNAMPKNMPQNCKDDCATNVAAYIESWTAASSSSMDSSSSSMEMSSSSTASEMGKTAAMLGKQSFDAMCAGCHGNTPIDLSNGLGQSSETDLATFIHNAMPKTDPTKCEDDCAANIAQFILSWPQSSVQLGKQSYGQMCSGCHGANGQGGTPINLSNGLSRGHTDLATFIHDEMPNGTPENCEDDCADNIAAFINSWTDETTTFAASRVGYTVSKINNCGVSSPESEMSTVVFDSDTNGITGWSHIRTSAPYNLLSYSGDWAQYNVPGPVTIDASCNDTNTQKVSLVKKYANWDQQHSNGIEPSIVSANKTFADIQSIVIEFKLNGSVSAIPSKDEVMQKYGDVLTDTEYDQLDKYMAAFSVIVMDQNGGNASSLSLQAERYVELDQTTMADQWLKIVIPFEEMNLFTTQDYARSNANIENHASVVADRLQIVAETYGTRDDINNVGWVIRNFLSEQEWTALAGEASYEETFKEISLTIKKVEVIWK